MKNKLMKKLFGWSLPTRIAIVLTFISLIIAIILWVLYYPPLNIYANYITGEQNNAESRPYVSIDNVARIFNNASGQLEIRLVLKNAGSLPAKITEIQYERLGKSTSETYTKNHILYPEGWVGQTIYLRNDEIYTPHIFRYRIVYTSVSNKDTLASNYCIEYHYSYEGNPSKFISMINSTVC